ncbi:MAG: sortase [Firmicutes bacterium]|nr:sortase [Bacillota bacterium]
MKWVRWIGIIIIIISFLYGIQFEMVEVKKNQQNKQIISLYEKHQNQNKSIIGTIEIVKNKQKVIIRKGNTEEIISKKQVSLLSALETKALFLAGHSIPEVFGTLHESKVGDELQLDIRHQKKSYQIYDIEIIDITDESIFYEKDSFEKLVLITCMKDENKRLIVKARRLHVN